MIEEFTLVEQLSEVLGWDSCPSEEKLEALESLGYGVLEHLNAVDSKMDELIELVQNQDSIIANYQTKEN